MSMMAFDTVPSMLFMVATSCVALAFLQKPVCDATGDYKDECNTVAKLGYPAASILASSAAFLFFLTHIGMLGRGSMMGGYGSMGYGSMGYF